MSEANNTKQAQDFSAISARTQILKRPGQWIGTMDEDTQNMFVISEDSVEYKEVTFIPAFRKIIDEILDNSIDAIIKYHNAKGTIKVDLKDDSVCIEDDGPGIPVIKASVSEEEKKSLSKDEVKNIEESYIPYVSWTRLFSGTNFNDDDDSTVIGSHGVGSKCASIFSTKFVGFTDDGKASCTVTTLNNLETSTCKVGKTKGTPGTTVTFWPDFERFKLTKIDEIYKNLTYQRLTCLAICYPDIKFIFNKKQIKVNDKKFLNRFSENVECQLFNGGFIGVYPNEFDDFKYFSYVNGLYVYRGGSHIDYVMEQLVNVIRNKLIKTYKTIKPADIKNKITLVLFMKDFANLRFDSQTKETVKNSRADITNYFNVRNVDFEKFGKQILKNNFIIDPIVDMFKMKEQLKTKQQLDKAKKVKVVSDKYMPAIGKNRNYIALCEGLCLEKNTEVFSAYDNSSVAISDIKEGDAVLSHTQSIEVICGKSASLKSCVELTTKSGRKAVCSKNHRWFVYDSAKNEFLFKKVTDLDINTDKMVINKLGKGFFLDDVNIEHWNGEENSIYTHKIYGKSYSMISSLNHTFVVFDTVSQKLETKCLSEINCETDKLVLMDD